MSYEKDKVRRVYQHYGSRISGGDVGQESSINSVRRFVVGINNTTIGPDPYIAPVIIPKGAKLAKATLFVNSPITLTADKNVIIGDGTNGITITDDNLSAAGTKDVTTGATGTWASTSATGLTKDQVIAVKNEDTTLTDFPGDATLVLEFEYK